MDHFCIPWFFVAELASLCKASQKQQQRVIVNILAGDGGLTAQAFSCVSVQSELSPDEFQMMSSIENGLCCYNLFLETTVYSWETTIYSWELQFIPGDYNLFLGNYSLFLGSTIYSWELELVMAIPAALTAALADAEEKRKSPTQSLNFHTCHL